jgi:hypothetical protein
VRELLNLIDIFSHSSIPGELSEMTIRASNIFETFMAGFAAIAIGVIQPTPNPRQITPPTTVLKIKVTATTTP